MSRLPSSEPARRISALYRRRMTTPWHPKEIKAFRALIKDGCFDSLDDLALIERYYAFERRKGDKGMHRRDLCTFVNNWMGELDRAREWERLHPPVRKIIPLPVSVVTSNQPEVICSEEERAKFKAAYEQRYGRPLRGA